MKLHSLSRFIALQEARNGNSILSNNLPFLKQHPQFPDRRGMVDSMLGQKVVRRWPDLPDRRRRPCFDLFSSVPFDRGIE